MVARGMLFHACGGAEKVGRGSGRRARRGEPQLGHTPGERAQGLGERAEGGKVREDLWPATLTRKEIETRLLKK